MARVIVPEELTMRGRLERLGAEIKATDQEEEERPQANQGRHAQSRADPPEGLAPPRMSGGASCADEMWA